ncbi:peptide-methionine (S)-S-oxide reductase [Ekhidna lutea]|uniref:peptide-methionine (S)-S-oxide reductase n=1 Tax=Ekhidna lutea TaxID=447679 RepID=A0A239K768_EKHLU|nr:peptide-methionine (S)-S-oxide reductase [Ekhidna lutea]SNT13459.1 peptide-methionine (S)-S-oxide reductase [Ekhidna lutea]
MDIEKIGFGGGCHWCTEGVFSIIKGVTNIDQGWIASKPPNDQHSEAVLLLFNPSIIQQEDLISIHLQTHACTSGHSMREKYRSAIYTFNQAQALMARQSIDQLQVGFNEKIITEILPFYSFKPSQKKYQNYYQKNPKRPFCETYISPKVLMLLKEFNHLTV